MKPRRFTFLIAVVSFVIVCFVILIFARSDEPTYQGKTSGEWFGEFRAARARPLSATAVFSIRFSPGGNVLLSTMNGAQLSRDPVAAGLRALGTNAAVYLAGEFSRRDPFWAAAYRRLLTNLPPAIQKLAPRAPATRLEVREDVSQALQILATNAAVAIPKMVQALSGFDPISFRHGIGILGQVPARPLCRTELVEPVLKQMCNRGQLTNAVDVIDVLWMRTPLAAQLLASGLSAADLTTRRAYAVELDRFGMQALPVLPAVSDALKDPDDEVRYYAARTLENLGTNAFPARVALERATNDPSVMVQRVTGRVLRMLSGQAPSVLDNPFERSPALGN